MSKIGHLFEVTVKAIYEVNVDGPAIVNFESLSNILSPIT